MDRRRNCYDKKESLFYLVRRYCVGEYEILTFCDAFYEIYYPDRPIDECVQMRLEQRKRLMPLLGYERWENFEKAI